MDLWAIVRGRWVPDKQAKAKVGRGPVSGRKGDAGGGQSSLAWRRAGSDGGSGLPVALERRERGRGGEMSGPSAGQQRRVIPQAMCIKDAM